MKLLLKIEIFSLIPELIHIVTRKSIIYTFSVTSICRFGGKRGVPECRSARVAEWRSVGL